jgi:CheY-like chemotaxis protein
LLVVDDLDSVRVSVAYFLEYCGYRALSAESGEAAIEMVRNEQIDGVLLDVQMPAMSGIETCRRLHALAGEIKRPVKVWFISRETKESCVKAGGLAVFRKPFEWPEILNEIEKGLGELPVATAV